MGKPYANKRRGDDYKHITRPALSKVAALWDVIKASFFSEGAIFVHKLSKTEVLNLFIRISLIPYILDKEKPTTYF